MINAFAQQFAGPPMSGPIAMPMPSRFGAPVMGAPAGAAPTGQLPAPAPVGLPMQNAFAQHIMQPPSGGYGVRNMMPPVMPSAVSGNPINAFRTRMGLQPL